MAKSAESRARRVLGLAVAALVLTVVAGCGLFNKADNQAGAAPADDQQSVTAEPTSDAPTTEPPAEAPPTTKPTPKKTTVTKKPPAKAAPTVQPFWEQLPACAHLDKTKPVAKTKVKAALKVAAGKTYWQHEAPQLKLNYPLVKAVAWMESGWQSNIHNCDGGTGVMQVMPDTVSMINGRFGLDYDPSDYQQNTQVGANYLAWLTKWVDDTYFKSNYNLSASKCKTTTSWCLLNLVISGYNAGQGALEQASTSKKLPNPQYVATVRALMTRCECDRY